MPRTPPTHTFASHYHPPPAPNTHTHAQARTQLYSQAKPSSCSSTYVNTHMPTHMLAPIGAFARSHTHTHTWGHADFTTHSFHNVRSICSLYQSLYGRRWPSPNRNTTDQLAAPHSFRYTCKSFGPEPCNFRRARNCHRYFSSISPLKCSLKLRSRLTVQAGSLRIQVLNLADPSSKSSRLKHFQLIGI